jgi:tripartite-type tricarboxylate transporter receptor subunit TctC
MHSHPRFSPVESDLAVGIDERYFEDYAPGTVVNYGPIEVDADEIIDFARRYDPQEFHIDPARAADGPFRGLVASGWHTASMMIRVLVERYLSRVTSLRSPGVDELARARSSGRPTVVPHHRARSAPFPFETGPRNAAILDRGLQRTWRHPDDRQGDDADALSKSGVTGHGSVQVKVPVVRRKGFEVARCAFALWLACCAGAWVPVASATEYPDRPVHLIVPFPPGGGADNLARTIMPKVSQALGQPIVIENKPGAGGNVGAELVARAAPDGYTLLYGTNGTHSINSSLYRNLRFDPVKDFAPVSRMTSIAAMLIVNPKLPAQSVAQLIDYARAHPGKLNFASAGNGTTSHLAGELFKTMAGIDIVHIPYRGGALAITDLIGGQVEMMIEVMPNAYPLAREGRVRGIAVSTARRVPSTPELPTIDESGLPGFEVSAWDGVLAPAGTPAPIIAKLNAAIRLALEDPEIIEALKARGAQPVPSSPEEFARHIAINTEKWAKVVKASGAKID